MKLRFIVIARIPFMLDFIREWFYGEVAEAPRANAVRVSAAVEEIARRISEEEDRERRKAEYLRYFSKDETKEDKHDGSIRYKSRNIITELSSCVRRHESPNLHAAVLSFPARLLTLVKEKCDGIGKIAYTRAHVSRQIYSRIVSWDDSRADKATVMKLCLGLQLNRAEADRLMQSAGYAFSMSIPADCAVVYAIENGIWNLDDVNEILARVSQPPL